MGIMLHFSSEVKEKNELVSEQLPKDKNGIIYNFGILKYMGQPYDKPVWYSFDLSSLNYHITPKKEDIEDYLGNCRKCRNDILEELESREGELGIVVKDRGGKGTAPWTECHRWVEVTKGEFSYLLCFQSLYCTKNNLVSCDFGKIQFQKFFQKNDGPNRDSSDSFVMMYPEDGEEEKVDGGICVRNTNFTVESNTSEIITAFVSFINQK